MNFSVLSPSLAPAPFETPSTAWLLVPECTSSGVPHPPVRSLVCGCGHMPDTSTHPQAGVDRWVSEHVEQTGHRSFAEYTMRRLRAVPAVPVDAQLGGVGVGR